VQYTNNLGDDLQLVLRDVEPGVKRCDHRAADLLPGFCSDIGVRLE
jgi:hypothetical protein